MLRRAFHTLAFAAVILVLMLAPAYSAVVAVYDNSTQSLYNTLVQTTGTVTFDDALSGPNHFTLKTDANGFSLGAAGNTVQFVGIDHIGTYSTNITWYPGNEKDWGTNAVLTSGAYNGDTNRWLHVVLPAQGATAISLNLMTLAGYGPYSSGGNFKVVLSTGDTLTSISTAAWSSLNTLSPSAGGITPTWFGLRSDAPIQWLDFQSDSGAMLIDNFQFGTSLEEQQPTPPQEGEAPEAATMILIGTGLAGLRMLRKFSSPTPA